MSASLASTGGKRQADLAPSLWPISLEIYRVSACRAFQLQGNLRDPVLLVAKTVEDHAIFFAVGANSGLMSSRIGRGAWVLYTRLVRAEL
jgi:hypothetical protein